MGVNPQSQCTPYWAFLKNPPNMSCIAESGYYQLPIFPGVLLLSSPEWEGLWAFRKLSFYRRAFTQQTMGTG